MSVTLRISDPNTDKIYLKIRKKCRKCAIHAIYPKNTPLYVNMPIFMDFNSFLFVVMISIYNLNLTQRKSATIVDLFIK